MLPSWTGNIAKKMHIYEISRDELAKEIGCTGQYISFILHGKRTPPDGRERIEKAISAIIERRS